jgi:hypothetical protein
MVLECFYLSNGLKLQIYCINDWQGKIHLMFTAVSASTIDFSIYGIRQKTVNAISYQALVEINNIQYYASAIADSMAPNTVSAQPIMITG